MSLTRAWALAALVVLAASCARGPAKVAPGLASGVAPESPRALPFEGLPGGQRLTGPSRPRTFTTRFDVDDVPVAAWGAPPPDAGFTIGRVPSGVMVNLRSPVLAEITVSQGTVDAPGPLQFTTFTCGQYYEGTARRCGPSAKYVQPARWAGVDPSGWTDEGVDVELGEATLDMTTCRAKATSYVRARAVAIVAGFAYALRVTGVAKDGIADDVLYVFLPSGLWAVTTGDPSKRHDKMGVGCFTRLSFHLERGRAEAVTTRMRPSALHLWEMLRDRPKTFPPIDASAPVGDLLSVDVEVASQGDTTVGTLSLGLPEAARAAAYARLVNALESPPPLAVAASVRHRWPGDGVQPRARLLLGQ